MADPHGPPTGESAYKKKLKFKSVCTKCFTPTTVRSFKAHFVAEHLDGVQAQFTGQHREQWERCRMDQSIMSDESGARVYFTAVVDGFAKTQEAIVCFLGELAAGIKLVDQKIQMHLASLSTQRPLPPPPPIQLTLPREMQRELHSHSSCARSPSPRYDSVGRSARPSRSRSRDRPYHRRDQYARSRSRSPSNHSGRYGPRPNRRR